MADKAQFAALIAAQEQTYVDARESSAPWMPEPDDYVVTLKGLNRDIREGKGGSQVLIWEYTAVIINEGDLQSKEFPIDYRSSNGVSLGRFKKTYRIVHDGADPPPSLQQLDDEAESLVGATLIIRATKSGNYTNIDALEKCPEEEVA